MSLMQKFNGLKAAAYAGTLGALFTANSVMAQAAGLDLSGAQTEVLGYVTTTIAFIVAIGVAVLGMVMIAKAVRWARRAG